MTYYTKFLSLLAGYLVAGLVGMTCFAQNALAEVIELKVSHYLPPNHVFHKELLRWSEELKTKSNGQLVMKVFPAGQMGPLPRQFDLARTGVADIALGLHGSTPGRFPMTEIAHLPYMVAESAESSKLLTELAPKYLANEHAGVRILYLLATPPLKFHMSKARINSLADFKGLRIRYAGEAFANTVKAFGGVPVAVSPAETADAMSKGIVDGALFPFEGAQAFQLGTETKFSYEPGVNAATFFLVMNPKSYAKLPANLRKLIDDTTGPEAAHRVGAMLDAVEKEGRAYMLSKSTQVVTVPDALAQEMKAAVKPLVQVAVAKVEERHLPAKEFYSAFQKTR
jgi:TRAP-type C4-dicarboxylate transport system substrate-binding protein